MVENDPSSNETTDNGTAGFLSAQTKQAMFGAEPMTEDVQEQVARELHAALIQLAQVRLHLPDENIQYLMQDGEAQAEGRVANKAQSALSTLYTMFRVSDHDAERQVQKAIETAERSQGQVAAVDLEVTTSPLLPPDEVMEKVENGDTDELSYHDINQLWYAEEIDPERLAEWIVEQEPDAKFEEEVTRIRREREAAENLLRLPMPAETDIESVIGNHRQL